jgi:hypothetical protein
MNVEFMLSNDLFFAGAIACCFVVLTTRDLTAVFTLIMFAIPIFFNIFVQSTFIFFKSFYLVSFLNLIDRFVVNFIARLVNLIVALIACFILNLLVTCASN